VKQTGRSKALRPCGSTDGSAEKEGCKNLSVHKTSSHRYGDWPDLVLSRYFSTFVINDRSTDREMWDFIRHNFRVAFATMNAGTLRNNCQS
jgi:hypothetical protein